MVGYSRLMEADEEGVIARQKKHRGELIDLKIAEYHGRIVKLMGDGMLVEFASAVDAVRCAVAMQQAMAAREADVPEDRRIRYRIGVNLGDIVIDGDDILGDGVNVAARLEGLAVPGGVCISDAVHQSVAGKISQAFEYLGEQQVKNIKRPIKAYGLQILQERDGMELVKAGTTGALALPDKPSIVVLPFENMSGDPDQEYFSDGITDDIITDLSRYGELFVIARHSAFAYRGRDLDFKKIAAALGVQFIAHGSVRRAGKHIRVTAQLVDASAGNQVWAERYDRDLEDLFAVQDEITAVIVNSIAGELSRQHFRRTLTRGPDAMDAYDHALRAMEFLWKVGPEENLKARKEAERAIAIAPQFARAHAMIAWTYVTDGSNSWSDDVTGSFQAAFDAAMTAVAADDRDPWGHLALGWAHIWRDHAHEQGLDALRKARQLNPSNAHFRSMLSWGLGWAGKVEDAVHEIDIAMRLNPHFPDLYHLFRGRPLFIQGKFEEALPHFERAAIAMPGHANGLALAAACYAALGRIDEAQSIGRKIVEVSPNYTLGYVRAKLPYARSEDLDFFVEMLRKAELPG